jgi:hypothetical protein
MSKERNESNEEVDCLVTVNDGAYMTCDMIEEEEETSEEKEIPEDYDI